MATIYNLRREAKAEDYLAKDVMESLHSMWLAELTVPQIPKKGTAEFRYLQEVSCGPFMLILSSHPQLCILNTDFKKFQPSEDEPLYMIYMDGTGGIVSKPHGHKNMNIDNRKQRMLFSISRPIKIQGDSHKPTIFPFATFITNDKSTKCLRHFLWSFRLSFENAFHYWPPFHGIVVDQDWAEINAILHEFNNHMSVSAYIMKAYKHAKEANGKTIEDIPVVVQLCSVHLFKHIHRDTKEHSIDPRLREVVNVIFVHIIHARSYHEFLYIFNHLITILLADETSKRNAIRELVLYEKCKEIFNTSIDHEAKEECMLDDENEAIYKSSPFYKDCMYILEEAM